MAPLRRPPVSHQPGQAICAALKRVASARRRRRRRRARRPARALPRQARRVKTSEDTTTCGGGATRSAVPTRPARRTRSRAQVARLLPQTPHTACSPFPLARASHVPISSLNPPADLLAVASAASSVAVDVENGRNDAPFEFRLTLVTCTCSKVAAAVAETAWLRVACAWHAKRRGRGRARTGRPRARDALRGTTGSQPGRGAARRRHASVSACVGAPWR